MIRAAAKVPATESKPAVCPLDCADTCSLTVEVVVGKMTKLTESKLVVI